jgi:prolyl oligopeptidase
VKVTEDDFPIVAFSPGAPKYLLGVLIHGVKSEVDLYARTLQGDANAKTMWKKVADEADAVTDFNSHGDSLYLLSHKDASRFKVLRTNLENPDLAHAMTVVPTSDRVVVGISAAGDALYVQDLDGGIGRLRRLPYNGSAIQPVKLPFEGAIQSLFANPTESGAWLELTSWTKSPLWYSLDANSGNLTDTGLVAPNPVDY